MDHFYRKYYDLLLSQGHDIATIEDKLKRAGYFHGLRDVENCISYPTHFLSTPFEHLRPFINKDVDQYVILVCGAFAPMHSGHLGLMKTSRSLLQSAGYNVIGGYISPSHDNYVLTKENTEQYCAEDRVEIARDVIHENNIPWCEVDPWESMYIPDSVNFTTVIDRLQSYLRKNLGSDRIYIAFAFGEDNYLFTHAFHGGEVHVCIARDYNSPRHEMVGNGIWGYHADEKVVTLNSNRIRKEKEYRSEPKRGDVMIRSTQHKGTFSEIYKKHEESISGLLALTYLSRVRVKEISYNPISIENAVNLDALSNEHYEHNIGISRLFLLSGSQKKQIAYVNRPGTPHLSEQIENLPDRKFVLVDDDISTGGTMNFVQGIMEKHGKTVIGRQSMLDNTQKYVDILDIRDFIMGSEYAGLVISVNGKTYRVPYILPFVNLRSRANMTMGNTVIFSRNIFHINEVIHRETNLRVKDCPDGFYHDVLGYNTDYLLADIAKEHSEIMKYASTF